MLTSRLHGVGYDPSIHVFTFRNQDPLPPPAPIACAVITEKGHPEPESPHTVIGTCCIYTSPLDHWAPRRRMELVAHLPPRGRLDSGVAINRCACTAYGVRRSREETGPLPSKAQHLINDSHAKLHASNSTHPPPQLMSAPAPACFLCDSGRTKQSV